LVNLLLTDVGERVMNPTFGCNLRRFIFEGITESNLSNLIISLSDSIRTFIPEITVTSIEVVPNTDYNTIDLSVNYVLNVSNAPDQVTLQFN
jgi:phage baseplate assembly protein W